MALIDQIKHLPLQSTVSHTPVDCTFDVITDSSGEKYLQLDTYGSKSRQLQGKKSQSLRLSPSAISQLKAIFLAHGL